MKRAIFIALALLLIPTMCAAWSLEWDDNTETDLAGYRVYTSAVADMSNNQMIAEVTESCYELDDAMDGNFFAVTAFDLALNESDKSNIVHFVIPEPPDTTPPAAPGNLHQTENTCAADFTMDGKVNVVDYLTYWRSWISERGKTDCIQPVTGPVM